MQEDKIGFVVSGHNVSASVEGAYRIVVTDLSGKTIADKIIDGGSLYVPVKGLYVVTVYAKGKSESCKIIIK